MVGLELSGFSENFSDLKIFVDSIEPWTNQTRFCRFKFSVIWSQDKIQVISCYKNHLNSRDKKSSSQGSFLLLLTMMHSAVQYITLPISGECPARSGFEKWPKKKEFFFVPLGLAPLTKKSELHFLTPANFTYFSNCVPIKITRKKFAEKSCQNLFPISRKIQERKFYEFVVKCLGSLRFFFVIGLSL